MELRSVEKARFWIQVTPDLLESKDLIISQDIACVQPGAQRDLCAQVLVLWPRELPGKVCPKTNLKLILNVIFSPLFFFFFPGKYSLSDTQAPQERCNCHLSRNTLHHFLSLLLKSLRTLYYLSRVVQELSNSVTSPCYDPAIPI